MFAPATTSLSWKSASPDELPPPSCLIAALSDLPASLISFARITARVRLARWSYGSESQIAGGLQPDAVATKPYDRSILPTWKERSSFESVNEKTNVDRPTPAASEAVAWRKRSSTGIGPRARLLAGHLLQG